MRDLGSVFPSGSRAVARSTDSLFEAPDWVQGRARSAEYADAAARSVTEDISQRSPDTVD